MRMPLLLPGVPLGLRMQLPFMALLGVYESPLCVLLKILMQLLFVSPRGAARVADGGQDPALRVDDDDDDSAVCGCHWLRARPHCVRCHSWHCWRCARAHSANCLSC